MKLSYAKLLNKIKNTYIFHIDISVINFSLIFELNKYSNLNNLSDYTKYTPLILKHTQLSEEILKQYNNNLFDLPTGIYLTDFTTTSFLPELWGRLEIYSNGGYKYLRFITKQHMYFKIEGKDIFRLF